MAHIIDTSNQYITQMVAQYMRKIHAHQLLNYYFIAFTIGIYGWHSTGIKYIDKWTIEPAHQLMF